MKTSADSPAAKDHEQVIADLRRKLRRTTAFGVMVILVFMVPIGLWLAKGELSSAVIAPGAVRAGQEWRPIQHAEGGIVGEVKAAKGQHVEQGDVLLVLNSVRVAADHERLRLRILDERAAIARLEAEERLAARVAMPTEIAESQDPKLQETRDRELRLFELGRKALLNQTALLRDQNEALGDEIKALIAQRDQVAISLQLKETELATSQDLVRSGFVSESRANQEKSGVAELAARLKENQSEIERARQRRLENMMKSQALQSEYRDRAAEQLRLAAIRLSELEQELRKTEDATQRLAVVAPISGELIEMLITSPGQVIGPGQIVANIVPTNAPLVVEARVRAEDIGLIAAGAKVNVQLPSLSHLETRQLHGSLSYISADRIEDANAGGLFYRAVVEVDRESLAELGYERLVPGMPAEIYITGVTRTPAEYLLEPIARVVRRSAREF